MVADATYRTFLKDANGNLLTKQELQDPKILREATGSLPNYSVEYTYQHTAHVRLAALRTLLDRAAPKWEESLDWTLLLERRSFAAFSFLPRLWYFFWWCAWCLGGSQTTVYASPEIN